MCPWPTWRMPRTGYECVVLCVCLTGMLERKKEIKWSRFTNAYRSRLVLGTYD